MEVGELGGHEVSLLLGKWWGWGGKGG